MAFYGYNFFGHPDLPARPLLHDAHSTPGGTTGNRTKTKRKPERKRKLTQSAYQISSTPTGLPAIVGVDQLYNYINTNTPPPQIIGGRSNIR